nr:hypothetical protein BaRGS_009851 [Batillaria attramentaria]
MAQAYQSQSAESLSGSSASLTESGRLDAEEPAYSPMHRSAVKLSVTSPSGQRPSSQPPFQTSSPRLVGDEVVGRKVLFENGKNENNVPGKLPNRHLTELEKITRQRKFASVATRMASFEKSSDEENDEPQAREATPPQAQPGVKVRRVSLEHYPQPELEAQPSGGEMTAITCLTPTLDNQCVWMYIRPSHRRNRIPARHSGYRYRSFHSPDASMEDAMAKLHRRTSYLMATARDRSNNAGTVLDSSVSPYSMAIPEEPT